jgi:hypothetical protein
VGDAVDDDDLPWSVFCHLKKTPLDIQVDFQMFFEPFEQGCDVLTADRLAFANPPILDHVLSEGRAVLQSSPAVFP